MERGWISPIWQFALAFALLSRCGVSQWVVETNSVRVKEPAKIAGEFDAAIGDFGVPLYGASMEGELVYPAGNPKGCSPFPKKFTSKKGLPVILIVDRGDCYFIEKAYNAEQAGAKAILVADYKDERLLTMAAPEDRPEISKLKDDISIPTALIQMDLGTKLKDAMGADSRVIIELDWKDSMLNPDERVEWEFWTSSNDGCGAPCDRQSSFKKEMRDSAVEMEKNGYTFFTPYFKVRKCAFDADSDECKSNCIMKGRYCAADSIGDKFKGKFKGKQVVEENLRQLCVFKLATDKKQPWLWWEYAANYAEECTMANGKFGDESCIHDQLQSIGLSTDDVNSCMGNINADSDSDILEACIKAAGEDAYGNGRILLLPTVAINNAQYRGRLDVPSVVRGICAGFSETTEPALCLSGGLQTNECLTATHGCWHSGNASACIDTFRGHVCKCPSGYRGDGIKCRDIDECEEGTAHCDQICVNDIGGYHCECKEGFKLFGGQSSMGVCFPMDRCKDNNGGCEEACNSENGNAVCSCRQGLELASNKRNCVDIDECKNGTALCEQKCINKDPRITGLQYSCACNPGYAVDPEDRFKCIKGGLMLKKLGIESSMAGVSAHVGGGTIVGIIVAAACIAVVAGYAVHKLRLRRLMQSEIQSIM
eukprot:jgi/Botrbrau1/5758/Bobra.0134s0028.3